MSSTSGIGNRGSASARQRSFGDFCAEQPPVLAGLELAREAAPGAAFRSTVSESWLMGESGDELKEKAKDLASNTSPASTAEASVERKEEEIRKRGHPKTSRECRSPGAMRQAPLRQRPIPALTLRDDGGRVDRPLVRRRERSPLRQPPQWARSCSSGSRAGKRSHERGRCRWRARTWAWPQGRDALRNSEGWMEGYSLAHLPQCAGAPHRLDRRGGELYLPPRDLPRHRRLGGALRAVLRSLDDRPASR